MARCIVCGKQFQPKGKGKNASKYCSEKCRMRDYRRRKRLGLLKSQKKKSGYNRSQKLTKAQFDTLMTQGTDEALAFVASRLKTYISDPDTSASAMPALSREYLDVIREIDDRAKKQQGPASSEVTSIDAPVDLEQL